MVAVQRFREFCSELGSKLVLEALLEKVVRNRSDAVAGEVHDPRRIVKGLSGDLSRCAISLELDNDEVSFDVDAEDVNEAAEISLDFSSDHQESGAKNGDVSCNPLLNTRF